MPYCHAFKVAAKMSAVMIILIITTACHPIPPIDLTRTTISETFWRIGMYIREHRSYPEDLSVLPKRKTHSNLTTDAWGHPLRYSVDNEGIITVESLGQDAAIGGLGLDEDIRIRYRTRDSNGELIIDDENWIIDEEIRD